MINNDFRRFALLACVLLTILCVVPESPAQSPVQSGQSEPQPKLFWFKGNTHTHTLNSDGDSSPDEVVKWYREHGYNFVVITDHEFITPVDTLNASHGKDGQFAVFSGQEVTDRFGGKPYHVNGLGLQRIVMPQKGTGAVDTLQRDVNAVR